MNVYSILKKIKGFFKQKKSKINDFLENVFETKFDESVLLSYLINPFKSEASFTHTNHTECYTAGLVFKELGYNVDVIDFSYAGGDLNFEKYSVIYGFGEPLENSFFQDFEKKKITIFYGTGCFPDFSNTKTLLRVLQVYKQKGKLIPQSGRLVEKSRRMSTLLSSGIIALGNEYTRKTYLIDYQRTNVLAIPAFFYDITNGVSKIDKNFDEAKINFLWFGSLGAIHKGLDLLLEVFSNRIDVNLHICGLNKEEEAFHQVYFDELNNHSNIKNHGFVNLKSKEFEMIAKTCGFVIHPSITEGGSPSVINAMGNGACIPIISEGCGLDIYDCGFNLKELTVLEIDFVVTTCSRLPSKVLSEKATESQKLAKSKYNIDNYKINLKNAISSIIHGVNLEV